MSLRMSCCLIIIAVVGVGAVVVKFIDCLQVRYIEWKYAIPPPMYIIRMRTNEFNEKYADGITKICHS